MHLCTRATLAVAFLLGFFSLALAQYERSTPSITTRSLYNDCRGNDPRFCHGFVAGVAKAMRDIRTLDINLREDYCPRPAITTEDRAALFKAWAESRQKWETSAYESVYMALWFGESC
jgi:hypothetical protein